MPRVLGALLGLVTLLAYLQVARHDFIVYDDPDYVTANPYVQRGLSWDGLRWAFSSTHPSNWHPLTWLSHMLDVQLFGLRPWGHHLMSVLGHSAAAWLLFHVFRRMTGALWPSAWLAALFAWHPLRVESVAWVAERKDVLSAVFWMFTLLAYLRYTERPTRIRYATVLLTFSFGLMTKPMLVTLPFVLLLIDWWPLKRLTLRPVQTGDPISGPTPRGKGDFFKVVRRLAIEKLPLFALAAASCLLTLYVQRKGHSMAAVESLTLPVRLANALVAYLAYVLKTVWPANLAVFYPLPPSQPVWKLALAATTLGGITTLAVRRLRSQPYFLAGWLWYLGTLVPVIGLVQVGDQAMADRYTYLPTIGLGIMLVWGAESLIAHRPSLRLVVRACGVLAAAICLWLTGKQVTYWKDSQTLFQHTLSVTKQNYLALNVLGSVLLKEGKLEEARELFLKSLAIRPDEPMTRYCLGSTYAQEGRYEEAVTEYREALARPHPASQEVHNALGLAFLARQQYDEALAQFNEAVRLNPSFLDPLFNRAVAYLRQGRLEEAWAGYTAVLKLRPDHKPTLAHLLNLTGQLIGRGRSAEAIPILRRVLDADPDSLGALNRLAWLLATHEEARVRNGIDAIRLATHACELTGYRHPHSLNTLAAAYAEMGRFEEAVRTAQQAITQAQAAGETRLEEIVRELLQLYQMGFPYREVTKQG